MKFLMDKDKENNSRVTINIPNSIIEKSITKKLLHMKKSENINGFRKGKAPIKILQKKYGDNIYYDVFNELMQKFFQDFIQQKQIKIIGNPKYYINKMTADLQYSVIYEKYPKFQVIDINNIIVEKNIFLITEKDIKNHIKNSETMTYKWKLVNRSINIDDKITINYNVYINNQKNKKFSKKDYQLILCHKNCLLPLYYQMQKKYVNDVFFCKIKFPEWHPEQEIKNQIVTLKIKIKKIEQKEIHPNKNIFKNKIKNDSIDSFKYEKIKKNIEEQLKNISENKVYKKIIDRLIQKNPIKIPPVFLKEEIQKTYLNNQKKYQTEGNNILKIDYHMNQKHKIQKRLHIQLIFQNIISQQKFIPDYKRVQSIINTIALNSLKPKETIRIYNREKNLFNHIQNIALEIQVMQFLLQKVQIVKKDCIIDHNIKLKYL